MVILNMVIIIIIITITTITITRELETHEASAKEYCVITALSAQVLFCFSLYAC